MCGLTGYLSGSGINKSEAVNCLSMMGAAIDHRGPDANSIWIDESIALAHRRLSIHDLSDRGSQPMISSSGRFVLVYNGEIYNFIDIRRKLAKKNVSFVGNSDTEVMLSAIEVWGLDETLRLITGMFAFALWDRKNKMLVLVRDRMGEKPLYYGWQGKGEKQVFLFGSELKSLRKHPSWLGDIDRDGLAQLLQYNYIPGSQTIHPGIRKLQPGQLLCLRWVGNKWKEETEIWWSLQNVTQKALQDPFCGDIDDAADVLDNLLSDVIRDQLVSDVPLGAFLSGGIDSSTVVGIMKKISRQPVQTFTVGYDDAAYDESIYAKDVAQHLGVENIDMRVTAEDVLTIIPRLASIYDEPFADASQVPTVLLSNLARRHVKVSLSGDGGDELFAGYNRHIWGAQIYSQMGKVPPVLRGIVSRLLVTASPDSWDWIFYQMNKLFNYDVGLRQAGEKIHRIASVLRFSNDKELYSSLVHSWKGAVPVLGGGSVDLVLDNIQLWNMGKTFTDRMTYLDAVTYLPDDILVKLDRAAMSASLETRAPFLDHRIVEFAASLPLSLKVNRGKGKKVLRRVLDRYVPRDLIERPKAGFGLPLGAWLRGVLREWAEDLLAEQRLRDDGYFDAVEVRNMWNMHLSGKYNLQYQLWSVLMFQAWNQSNEL